MKRFDSTEKSYLDRLAGMVMQELKRADHPNLKVSRDRVFWETETDGFAISVASLAGGGTCEVWYDAFAGQGVRTIEYCFASSNSARMREIATATADVYADRVLRRTSRDADFVGKIFRMNTRLPAEEFGVPIWESYANEHFCGVYMRPRKGTGAARSDAVAIARFFTRVAEHLRRQSSAIESPSSETEDAAISAAEAEIESAGQAFLADSRLKKALELYGMGKAKAELKKRFPKHTTEDVSADLPYDFQCSRGKDRVFVEVKCTQTKAGFVLLSRREVEHAQRFPKNTALIVVRSVKLDGKRPTGGEVEVFYPWDIAESKLVPIGFSCTLKRKAG